MINKSSHFNFIEGEVLLINKELNWTSFDVVKKVKNLIVKYLNGKKVKVGHAGTLDPLATGIMIICTGKETKKISEFQNESKEYIASLELGKTTPSFDLETEFDNTYKVDHITEELIKEKLELFKGKIMQVPPLFSAKWINGKRAYEFARKGKNVKLLPVEVEIFKLEIMEFKLPVLVLRILCSKGTYIRSLARDIGKALNSGAYLKDLIRTKVGKFTLSEALSINEFEKNLLLHKTNQ